MWDLVNIYLMLTDIGLMLVGPLLKARFLYGCNGCKNRVTMAREITLSISSAKLLYFGW